VGLVVLAVLSFSLSRLPLAFGAASRVEAAFCCAFGVPLVRADAAEGGRRTEAAEPGRCPVLVDNLAVVFDCGAARRVTGGDGDGRGGIEARATACVTQSWNGMEGSWDSIQYPPVYSYSWPQKRLVPALRDETLMMCRQRVCGKHEPRRRVDLLCCNLYGCGSPQMVSRQQLWLGFRSETVWIRAEFRTIGTHPSY